MVNARKKINTQAIMLYSKYESESVYLKFYGEIYSVWLQ